MKIPNIIWQTYKDPINSLAPYMVDAIKTWKYLNPEYDHRYMDDIQAGEFVLDEFGQEWYDIFVSMPVGVMRGDLWRYMVIYKYGGVYADLDTECLRPISSWMIEDKNFIVCPETSNHFCQWTFAATPEHPILKFVLDLIKDRLLNPEYGSPHFVHTHTGPEIWTQGILKALGIRVENLIDDAELLNSCDNAKLYKFYCYGADQWRIFHFESVKHIYGSQKWNDGNYVQWIEDPLVKGTR
jgi:mannosyltransferase OCH1-like enzyme